MAKSYRCTDDERIDLIVLDNYGSLEMLPHVLASNIHLSRLPLLLKSGTIVSLPDAIKTQTKVKKINGALW
jgi:phage tail protein X